MEQNERKNTSWAYNLNTHKLSALYPDDKKAEFDLTQLVSGLTQQQELVYQYGIKQWLASNYASCKTPQEKIDSANADFADLVKSGITLLGEGKIGVIGRTRANGSPKTMDAKVENLTMNKAEIKSALMAAKMGLVKFTPEMIIKLEKQLAEAK